MPAKITKRKLGIGAALAMLLVALALFGSAWYFAGVLEADGLRVNHSEDEFPFTVTDIDRDNEGETVISLRGASGHVEELAKYVYQGIESETAFGRISEIVTVDSDTVRRRLVELSGEFTEGDTVKLVRQAFSPFAEDGDIIEESVTVTLDGPLGPLPAWLLTPSQSSDIDRWAVLVHGRTSGQEETLAAWPALEAAGYNSLVVTYRNDEGNAPDESGYYGFGQTEWPDIEPAVRYALDEGAEEIALVGYSMGGAIAVSFMERSELAGEVDLLVLDAPMLDFGRTVDLGAEERGVPAPVTWLAKRIASVRFDIDWDALNYLSRIESLEVPTLLFHGDDDPTVPVATSREMAEMLPELVTYEEFNGAGHVESWNSDPERYFDAITRFVESQ